MKKIFLGVLFTSILTGLVYAETTETKTDSAPPADTAAVAAPVEAVAPAPVPAAAEPAAPVEAPPAAPEAAPAMPAMAAPAPATGEPSDLENLEFVSGEVSGMDESVKTVTVKLYGENEDGKSDKVLTVKVDETTDITDGEKDRDLKSLTAGTEVDVEYDPATNKATYIFVY